MGNKKTIGIVATIAAIAIGGIIVYVFSQIYDKVTAAPEVLITDVISKTQHLVERSVDLDIVLFNQGVITAEDCFVIFNDGINPEADNKRSRIFELIPNEEETIQITTGIYNELGDYQLKLYVECKNFPFTKLDERRITISP